MFDCIQRESCAGRRLCILAALAFCQCVQQHTAAGQDSCTDRDTRAWLGCCRKESADAVYKLSALLKINPNRFSGKVEIEAVPGGFKIRMI